MRYPPVKRVGTGCSSIGNGPGPNDDLKSECRTSRRRAHSIETCSGLRKRSGRKHKMERCFDLAWQSEALGFTFVAVILRVEDPDRIARAAQDAGSAINRVREPDPITVVTDPFGGYWALIKREHAGREARSLNEVPRKTA